MILVCSDFSSHSDSALLAANKFAQQTGESIHLVHIAKISFYMDIWGVEAWFTDDIRNEFLSLLNNLLEEQAVNLSVKATTEVVFDSDVVHGVNSVLKKTNACMVFCGHKGLHGMDKFLLGSTTRKLISSCEVPVMVVKNDKITKMSVLVDGSESMPAMIETGKHFSEIFQTSLTIISLVPSFSDVYSVLSGEYSTIVINTIKESLNKRATELNQQIQKLVNSPSTEIIVKLTHEKDIGYHLKEQLEDIGSDIAIVRRHSKNFLNHFFLGSVSQRVVESYEGNVLVLPSGP